MATTFSRLAQIEAKVLKYVTSAGHSTGGTTTVIETLKITQPVSIDYNTAQRVGTTHRPELQSPFKFRMVLFEGDQDVQQGYVMQIAGVNYPVRHVEQWPFIVLGQTRNVAILEYSVRSE